MRRPPRYAFARGPASVLPLLALVVVAPTAAAQAGTGPEGRATPLQEPGTELRVELVTVGPGTEVWELFGHNAIRIQDPARGTDISYNWGIFDFDEPGFLLRFVRGTMMYWMAGMETEWMIQQYAVRNREVILQELELTPRQKLALRDMLAINALPENRTYRYDYFLDNCSTRARDALDRILDGRISSRARAEATGTTFRYHTRRLTRVSPATYVGIDFFMGYRGDRPISRWEEMFLPMSVRDELREITVPGPAGSLLPLVRSERVAFRAERPPEPRSPDDPWLVFLLAGGALGAALILAALLSRSAGVGGVAGRLALSVIGGVWSFAAGVSGVVMLTSFLTDHQFMHWNENFFLLNPLSLALVVLVPRAAFGRSTGVAARVGTWVLAVAVVGIVLMLLPAFHQATGLAVSFTLPVHVGLALALRDRASARPASGP